MQFSTQDTDLIHEWNFGDGTPISTDPNPYHIYSSTGIYIVTHLSRDFCDECAAISHTVEITLASITVKSILLNRYTAKVGDIITVTVVVQNLSSSYGSSTISIDFGGDILGPYTVTLNPNEETTFSADHQVIMSGMIDICADNVCTALFVESNISVKSVTVTPSVSTGEMINIDVNVENDGTLTEDKIIRTSLSNQVTISIDERTITLGPLESQTYTVSLDARSLPNGSYIVCADGLCRAITIAVPVGVGNLNIVTDPQNAEVFIDNSDKGATPTTITDIPSGDRSFKLTLSGHNDTTGIITVISNTTSYIYTSLVPTEATTGSIAIQSVPTGADIYIDGNIQTDSNGQPIRTPASISGLDPISHGVTLKLSGYENYDVMVDVEVGITKYISAVLIKAPILVGDINFTSIPDGAEIWLENKDTGDIEFTEKLTNNTIADLDIGDYDFELRLPGYNILAGIISVVGGLTSYVFATMVPIAPLTGQINVTSIPEGADIYINNNLQVDIDGQPIRTPAIISDLASDIYTAKLKKSGYQDVEIITTVEAGRTTYIGLTLATVQVAAAAFPWWLVAGLVVGMYTAGKKKEEKELVKEMKIIQRELGKTKEELSEMPRYEQLRRGWRAAT